MNNDIAISINNVSKKYCKSLKHSMIYGLTDIARNVCGLKSQFETLRSHEFWALDNISFEVKRGESFGLIGANGSGKTTLLKMINGIFWPDKGMISVRGKVGALIAVGAGFHPLLSGRENIYINGAILGMSKREMDEKFDTIIDFADIGDFLDTPVKHYSSGMYVRLGFAIAVHCDPEILLVDEVLAVGDRNFQIKCFQKIHELKKNKHVTIMLVSHNEYNIREYTQRSVVLEHGKMVYCGESEEAVSFYINSTIKSKSVLGTNDLLDTDNKIIKRITFYDGSNRETKSIKTGGRLVIDFHYESERKIKNPIIGINFKDSLGRYCAGFWNTMENVKLPDLQNKGKVRVTVDPCDLPCDCYSCAIVLCEGEESNVLEWRNQDQRLIVERPNDTRGFLKLRQKWEMLKSNKVNVE